MEHESRSSDKSVVSSRIDVIVDLLIEKMREQWRNGERQQAEDLIASVPSLLQHPNEAIRLVYEEICLRQEAGEDISEPGYVERFPQWSDELHVLLECHDLVQPMRETSKLPVAGDSIGSLQLIQELGQGAIGRVFLASENQLGCRLLVVKVTHRDMRESILLSRLQHTHIVPLYFVHDEPNRNLTAFCMPYLGGTTLDQLFREMEQRPLSDRTGKQLVEALDRFQRMPQDKDAAEGPVRSLLSRISYPRAVVWIGVCMAEALSHVHSRNLVHLDIKPSNILICADGQPMLLDFHLAREPIQAGQSPDGRLGGTWDYMPPEQRNALESIRKDLPCTATVDHRADIYALGAVLYVALTGARAASPLITGGLKRANPQVSDGLADVIEKCLSPSPQDRYQSMESLAIDLKSHLSDRPLAGVRNRSLTERWSKWRRRHPQSVLIGSMLAAVLSVVTASGWLVWSNTQRSIQLAKSVLGDSISLQTSAAQALADLEQIPGQEELKKKLRGLLDRMENVNELRRLHQVADQIRFAIEIESLSNDARARLSETSNRIWEHRAEFWQTSQASNNPEQIEQTRADLADVAVLIFKLRGLTSNVGSQNQSTGQADDPTLEEADQLIGKTLVVGIARNKNRSELSDLPLPHGVWEEIAFGREQLNSGRPVEAEKWFQKAIESNPQLFWPYFYKSVAAFKQARYEPAISALDTCIAISPGCAECFLNRAICLSNLGRDQGAIQDATRALERDPQLLQAALLRASIYTKMRQFDNSALDLTYAESHGAERTDIEYQRGLLYFARGDKKLAADSFKAVLKLAPNHVDSIEWLRRIAERP